MVPATPSKYFMATIPPQYAGRYRAQLKVQSKNGTGIMKDCYQFFFDVYEV
jgi:hypothetical protein